MSEQLNINLNNSINNIDSKNQNISDNLDLDKLILNIENKQKFINSLCSEYYFCIDES